MRIGLLVLGWLLFSAAEASAEWQIKPFLGLSFGGETTLVDLEHGAGKVKVAAGLSALYLGDVFGAEADIGHTPGFFEAGNLRLVRDSSVTTTTGNIVIAVPRHLTQYTLRPYLVGGAGVIRARIQDELGVLQNPNDLPAIDIGGGVTGFLTNRIGIGWEGRYFHSIRGKTVGTGQSFGAEELSFWRANMSLALRF